MDKDIIAVMVLGDGYLEKHGKGIRLQIKHSQRFKEYVEWKYEILKDLSPSPIYHGNGKYPFCRFITKTHPYLGELYVIFYRNGVRVIPFQIDKWLKTPRQLAVYFMDDGTVDKRIGSMLFETQCFPKRQIYILANCLYVNFGLRSTVHRSGKGRGLRLYLPVREAKKLCKIIEPYVLDCMRYKLLIPL